MSDHLAQYVIDVHVDFSDWDDAQIEQAVDALGITVDRALEAIRNEHPHLNITLSD